MAKLLLNANGKVLMKDDKVYKAPEGVDRLKKLLDTTKSTQHLFTDYKGTSVDDIISYNDTENVEYMNYMFQNSSQLTSIPQLNTSKVYHMSYMFYNCSQLTTLPQLDTNNVNNMYCMFQNCSNLTTISQLSMRSITTATGSNNMFKKCKSLTNLNLIDIGMTVQIGSGDGTGSSDYGHLLTLESLINIIKELRDYSDGSKSCILTMGSANLEKIANVYIRLTGEAEQDTTFPKLPCEVCEPTDDGAMLITAYANSKNWTLA